MKRSKKQIILLVSLIILLMVIYATLTDSNNKDSFLGIANMSPFNARNSSFMINEDQISLKNGYQEKVVKKDGVNNTITTRYFGNEEVGDLNRDGENDYAFMVVNNSGGTGTFYYAVIALSNTDGRYYARSYFLGDRIAPQSSNIQSNKYVVNFATRKLGQSFVEQPSVGQTMTFEVDRRNNISFY